MDKDFEKRLKDKMDNTSLKDIMPSFDSEATWAEIDDRMSAKKKRIVPVWFNYAAAVAVGLLLGGGLVKMWWSDTKVITSPTEVIVKKVPTTMTPIDTMTNKVEVQISTKSPATTQPRSVTPNQHIAKTKADKAETTKTAIEQITTVDTQEVLVQAPERNDKPITPTPEVKEKVVVKTTTSPIKKKTVHLLDIENEDRQAALNDVSAPSATRVRMVMQVPLQEVESGADHQSVMLRNIIK